MKKVCLLLIVALTLSFTGCRSINKSTASYNLSKPRKGQSQIHWDLSMVYRLDDSDLEKKTFEHRIQVEDVNITYQYGLESQAQCIAYKTNELILAIEDSIGMDIFYRVDMFLLRTDQFPQDYKMNFKTDPNTFIMPLFVTPDNDSCQAIISNNLIYHNLLMHELAEMSLIFHNNGGTILPDGQINFLFIKITAVNYTRWFREGLANYAGYLAFLNIRSYVEEKYPYNRWGLFDKPFS